MATVICHELIIHDFSFFIASEIYDTLLNKNLL
jgi:hypothetical protein